MGYEFKDGKHPAFRKQGEKPFLRLRSLEEGYSYEKLQAVLKGKTIHRFRGSRSTGTAPLQRIFNLLIDIPARIAEGKSMGYERWVTEGSRQNRLPTERKRCEQLLRIGNTNRKTLCAIWRAVR